MISIIVSNDSPFLTPAMSWDSVSLGISTSTQSKDGSSSVSSGDAGAGFKMVTNSSLLADAQNVSNGRNGNLLLKNDYTTRTGNGDGIELEWKISISSTSWLENWAFAPPTTMIEFSPVASIQILAVPVEAEGRI